MSREDLIGAHSKWRIASAAMVASVLAFGLLAHGVLEERTVAFDHRILLAFRDAVDPGRPVGPRWLAEALRDLTSLGSTTVLGIVVLAAGGCLTLWGRWAALTLLLASVLGGQALSSLLKLWFDRPRPSLVPGAPEVFTASFPSGHAMLSAVTYLTLGLLLSRIEPRAALRRYYLSVAFTLTAAVGVSRVALGVHWPTDVMAGWCAGAAWTLLCALAARCFERPDPTGRLA